MSKFLVLWSLEPACLGTETVNAVLRMPAYAEKLISQGKLEKRWHVVGQHGGAWIYSVENNEELDRLLAMAPVYNFAKYQILPLAEMIAPSTVVVDKS